MLSFAAGETSKSFVVPIIDNAYVDGSRRVMLIISNAQGGGRDHWSQAYSCWFAGGGIARGRIVGKTDKIAGTVMIQAPKGIPLL